MVVEFDVDRDVRLAPDRLTWDCRAAGTRGTTCVMDQGTMNGTGVDVSSSSVGLSFGLLGLGLIGSAIALGQFQRPPRVQPATQGFQPQPQTFQQQHQGGPWSPR